MRRASGRLLLIGLFMLALVGVVAAAPNSPAGAMLPAIVDFTPDVSSINYSDVEAGTAQVTLSWNTINTSDQNRLSLDMYQQNGWVSLLGGDETLPLSGSKQITVALPQNFGVPTYRLTLRNASGDVLEQQFVTLPYSPAAQEAPHIASFTTGVQSVDTNLLVQDNARLTVSWQIENRQPDTLIRFDQVLPDGSTVPADLPRHVLWVPSSGTGAVVPRSTSSKDSLTFRMSLVSLRDGTVYDQADITIPVTGSVMIAAPNTGGGAQPEPLAASALSASTPTINGSQISTFGAQSQIRRAGWQRHAQLGRGRRPERQSARIGRQRRSQDALHPTAAERHDVAAGAAGFVRRDLYAARAERGRHRLDRAGERYAGR